MRVGTSKRTGASADASGSAAAASTEPPLEAAAAMGDGPEHGAGVTAPGLVDIDLAALERGEPAGDDSELHVMAVGLLAAKPWQLRVKRIIDVVVAATALVLLGPLLLLTAMLIRFDSPGPVLFRQQRVGRDGKRFEMVKLRSMFVGAHDDRSDIAHANEATGPVFKMRNDPRVTRVGRVIRKLSVDELPQLWNVLKGDMSVVGPRPPLPEECVTYGRAHLRRLLVTPGLTCIWQVSGRSDIDFEEWVAMDVEYITTWNLRRDLVLMARTVPAVVSRKGAY